MFNSDAKRSAMNRRQGFKLFRAIGVLPVAGILAGIAILALDIGALHSKGLWEALAPSVREVPYKRGMVHDRLNILRLRQAPPGQPRVVVMGSSRAKSGFQPAILEQAERGGFAVSTLAHGGIGPFEIRSAVGDILSTNPDAVVLIISEFEITRPVYETPHFHFGSFSAIRDLIRENGLAYAFTNRSSIFRLTLGCILNVYRFREVFQRAFADDLRRFKFDERFDATCSHSKEDQQPSPLSPEGKRALRRFDALFGRDVRGSFDQVLTIKRGDHSRINQELLHRTAQRLSEAGVEVILVEAPNHPEAAEFYDTTIRTEFLNFADRLEQELGARFVPVEASGPYRSEDFTDLTHLNGKTEGTAKLTRAVIAAVNEVLELEDG